MALIGFCWSRVAWSLALPLSLTLIAVACGPPQKLVRVGDGGALTGGQSGEGGEGGTGGTGGMGGTAGTGGRGGTAGTGAGGNTGGTSGNGGTGGVERDASPDLPRDLGTPDLAADVGAPDVSPDLGPDISNAGKVVLLVQGYVPPAVVRPGDIKLKARLEGLGFMVKIGDDDGAVTQADGTALVIITETSGNQVAMKYTALAKPLICHKPALFDDLRLTTAAGATANTSTLEITQAGMAHPLAGGLMGTITIAGMALGAVHGAPAMTAERVATLPGQATSQVAVFGYTTGAMMAMNTAAPAKRVGLFISDAMASGMNDTGWKLFDAAVDWAIRP